MSGEEELSMETRRPTVPTLSSAPAEGVAEQAPLVSVRFQKDPHRKLKYLESEPKALGVTQITLSVFQIVSFSFLSAIDFVNLPSSLFNIIGSLVVMVAGVLALAAQNLRLPTLKACLGMQVLASVASVFNFLLMSTFSTVSTVNGDSLCWEYVYHIRTERNSTEEYIKTCHTIGEAVSHYQATGILIHAVLVAISVTLAAYCCKVINCCSPTSRMIYITDKGVCEESETSQPQNIAPAAEQGPLVSITFQTDPHRKQKYLESEPKALGVTQITFSVFKILALAIFFVLGLELSIAQIVIYLIGSVSVMVAGCLALAAQNLHLPTLKACLGMQVVACVVSILSLLVDAIYGLSFHFIEMCWISWNFNDTGVQHDNCMMLSKALEHYTAENLLIQAASVAISVTLAAYCCKVINCCSPTSRMPVITVQAPPTRQ